MKRRSLQLAVHLLVFSYLALAQTAAPDGPGQDAQWLSAGKQAVGTSVTLGSKVWFTLANGVMTEVMYPNISTANVQMLQFVVVNAKTKKVETEWDDATHSIESLSMKRSEKVLHLPSTTAVAKVEISEMYRNIASSSSLVFRQTNASKTGKWSTSKTYLTDPSNNTIVFTLEFRSSDPDDELYVLYDPSLSNSGMGDTAWTQGRSLVSTDGEIASALTCGRCRFEDPTNGFFGVNDGLTQIGNGGTISRPFARAEKGNVIQFAKVIPQMMGKTSGRTAMVFALGFGRSGDEAIAAANISLNTGFEKLYQEYQIGWINFLNEIPKVDARYQAQFNMAAMVVKALEDKTVRGANVASLTVPWGGGGNANTGGTGYRMIWSRDLYHVFTAFMALGDKDAAMRALDFLFNIQQKEDGSFPQNSWLDGKQGWGSLQMDEVGYPLIMAWQIGRFDKETYQKHVKPAADFIVAKGPFSPQERWEERPGYSPSTIAAEIAGLVCAADIAKRNGDQASAMIWLAAADDWARNIERWTATTNGKYGDGNYYIRISEKGEPDGNHDIVLNNNAGTFKENEIVDAGFLELVRLGIKPADDPLIVKSLKVIDQILKADTPNGPAFYRYNHDGYGEMDDGRKWNFDGKYTGKGRPWPLLSGERGEYEIALANSKLQISNSKGSAGNPRSGIWDQGLSEAKSRLDNMLAFANEGLMIPEQIWDMKDSPPGTDRRFIPELKFGEGTGSATPLAWSMGQFIRLATNLKAGKNLETPQIVVDRYRSGIPGQVSNSGGTDEEVILPPLPAGETIKYPRELQPNAKIAYALNGETRITQADANGKATLEFKMPANDALGVLGIHAADGATSFERVLLRLKPVPQDLSKEMLERIKAAKESPILDSGKVIFFYRGKAHSIELAGDITNWRTGKIYLRPVGEDLYAVTQRVELTVRTEYKFIIDGKWVLDPLNPKKIDNGVGGENSLLTMPDYKPTEWDHDTESIGKLESFEIESKALNGSRKIQVYVPQVQGNVQHSLKRSNPKYPAMYFADGSDYLTRARAVQVQENLVKAGKIKPFIMVFLDPKDRMKEYWANDQWAAFVGDEVVPEIDKRYPTINDREARATLGASLGGITSLWIGLKHPDKFARLGGQSSSFWVDNERVIKELKKLDPAETKFRFYIDDGTFEGADDTRRVNTMLRGKGYEVTYVEGETGHNWTAWRDRLADAFIALMK